MERASKPPPLKRAMRRGQVQSSDGSASETARRTTCAAYTALGWVVLFLAFHVYWYLGGSFASPGELPSLVPHRLLAWILEPFDSGWLLGPFVCLSIARGWARGRLATAAAALVWIACVLLFLRGGPGLIDDLTRATGLLSNGITGLSTKSTTGHASLRWSDWAIDSYFLLGGVIFALLARLYHAARAPNRPSRAAEAEQEPQVARRHDRRVIPGGSRG
jgi:hypothetical protein